MTESIAPTGKGARSVRLKNLLPVLILAAAGLLALVYFWLTTPGGPLLLMPCKIGAIEARCGKLKVNENRAAGEGRVIDLMVVVIPAKNRPAEPDPLFYLAGGPGGGAASQFLGTAVTQFAAINETRDLVYVDQRGTGQSNLMLCQPPGTDAAPGEVFQACLAELDGDLRFYTTAFGIDDLDDVRQALGYERINLYGMSYGVTAAQVYLNRHPEHVRSVILDHGALLQSSFFDHWASESQLGVERLFARCEADPACQQAYPNLRSEFADLYRQLENPVRTSETNPATLENVVMTRVNFGFTVHSMLVEDTSAAALPLLVHQAADGDWSGLARRYLDMLKSPAQQLRQIAMTLEILCYEPWWGGEEAAVRRLGAGSYYLDAALSDLEWLRSSCRSFPDPGESALHGPALPSDVPVLLLTGGIDPQDNVEGVAGYEQIWPNSLLVVQPGVSHNFTPTPCWNGIMADFVEKGSVENLPLRCVAEHVPPPFK